ncbi:hypothetical protein V3C99_016898 [Haemonchus contortus]
MSEAPKPPAKVGPASAIASARRDVSQLIEDLIKDLDKKLSDNQENQPNRSRSRSLTPAVTQTTGRTRSASSSNSNVQTAKSHTPYKSRFTSGIPGSSPGHVAVATAVRDNSAFSDTSAGSERVATALSPTAQMQQTLENEPVKRTPVTTETRRGRSPTVRSNVNSQANLKSYTNKVSTSRSPFSRATARSTTPRTATNTERTARPLLAGEQTMDALRRGKLFGRSKTPARAASARTSTTTPSTSTSEYMSNEVKTAAAIGTPCGRTLGVPAKGAAAARSRSTSMERPAFTRTAHQQPSYRPIIPAPNTAVLHGPFGPTIISAAPASRSRADRKSAQQQTARTPSRQTSTLPANADILYGPSGPTVVVASDTAVLHGPSGSSIISTASAPSSRTNSASKSRTRHERAQQQVSKTPSRETSTLPANADILHGPSGPTVVVASNTAVLHGPSGSSIISTASASTSRTNSASKSKTIPVSRSKTDPKRARRQATLKPMRQTSAIPANANILHGPSGPTVLVASNTAVLHGPSGPSIISTAAASSTISARVGEDKTAKTVSEIRSRQSEAKLRKSSTSPGQAALSTRTALNTDFFSPTSASGSRPLTAVDKDSWNLARNASSDTAASPRLATARSQSTKTALLASELSDEKKSQEVGIDDFLHKPASDQQKQLASPSHSGATPHTRRKEEVSLQSLWLLDSAQHPQDQDSLQTARARTPLDARARAGSGSLAYQSQSPLRTAIEDSMSPTPGVTTAAEIPMSPTPGVNTAIEETMSPTRGVDTAREISTAPRDPTNVFGTPQTDSTRTALPNFTPTSGVYTARSIDRTGSESIGPTGRIVQPQPRRLFGSDTYPRRSQSMQSDSSTSGNRTASIERRIALMRTRLYQQNQHHQAAPPISPYSSTSSSGPGTPEVRTARAIARRRGLFGPPSQLSQPSGGVRLGRLNRPSASTSSSAESGNRFRSGMFGQPSQIGTTSDTTSSAGIRVTFPERSLDSAGVTSTPAQNTPSGFTSSQQSRLPVLVRETTTPGLQRSTSSHLTDAPMGTAIPGSTSDGTARQFTTDGSFPSRSLSSEGSRPDSTGSELLGSGPQSRSKKIRPKRRILRRPDTRVTYYGGMRKPKRINKRDLKQRRRAIALMTPMLSEDRTQVVSPDTQSDRRRDETSASTRTAIGGVNTDLAEAIAKVTQQELESGNIVIHEQNPDGTFKLELHLSCRTTSPRGHLNISGHAPVGLRPKKVMINGKEVWVEN